MSKEKPYQPSEEEIKKAEEMMTNKQKEKSEERKTIFKAGYNKKEEEIQEAEKEKLAENIANTIRGRHRIPTRETAMPPDLREFLYGDEALNRQIQEIKLKFSEDDFNAIMKRAYMKAIGK